MVVKTWFGDTGQDKEPVVGPKLEMAALQEQPEVVNDRVGSQ